MTRSVGAIVAAALLPPLGVHLAGRGARDFWWATGLTALGFMPGAAFAMLRVMGDRQAPPER